MPEPRIGEQITRLCAGQCSGHGGLARLGRSGRLSYCDGPMGQRTRLRGRRMPSPRTFLTPLLAALLLACPNLRAFRALQDGDN